MHVRARAFVIGINCMGNTVAINRQCSKNILIYGRSGRIEEYASAFSHIGDSIIKEIKGVRVCPVLRIR